MEPVSDDTSWDDTSWVVTEFIQAELGDVRRTERLIETATVLAQHPSASFPQALGGSRAGLKAAYRFFNTDAIHPQDILDSHVQATLARIQSQPVVLAVQDTSELDFTCHPATEGIGPLSNPNCLGLLAHTTLALTPQRVPLGLLAQMVWARHPEEIGKRHTRKERPIEDKESRKWLSSLEAVFEAACACPDTHFISVADREADVYDLFLLPRPPNVDILIRAVYNRRVAHPEAHLWAKVQAQQVATTIEVNVPRREAQPARKATLQVRFCPVILKPPKHRKGENLPCVTVWAVAAFEQDPPENVEPIEWLLLTTACVKTVQDALERIRWYAARWGIEVLHKVLKSGCKIEHRQFETAESIKRCLPVFSVIAWRILYATMLSRALPDAPCTALLDAEEWQALYCAIHQVPTPPDQPPPLRQAVRWIARLGGFLDRKGDGEPGVTVLWKGFQRLIDLTTMYRIMRPASPKRKRYG